MCFLVFLSLRYASVSPAVLNVLGWEIKGDRLAVEFDLKDGALIVRKPSK